ncbi:MAG: SAM-dependent methyltransferase [Actinobacteria bacterium]|nr:SAM-dependent methyltransferase [Actinomycetota bacterium]
MTPLEEILVRRIAASGPMPFAAFMSFALYHPQHGYYTAGPARVGWRGHFLTSPELDPAFGELWADAFEQIWTACGEPNAFELIEIGPGEGAFAASVLSSVAPPFSDALSYRLVERSPALRERQRERLEVFGRVDWSASVTEVGPVEHGCVFANEVIDNLPVHLVEQHDGSLREVCVGVRDGRLTFVHLPPSNPELERYLQRCGIELPDGHRFEVGLAAESFVARVGQMFASGAAVFVDYGADADDLAQRPFGSLLAYSKKGTDERVLEDPGEKDITTHANWTAVENACRAARLQPIGPITQRRVLESLGLHALHDRFRTEYSAAVAASHGARALNALSRRQALGALADPGGLGGLQVVVATRGITDPAFAQPTKEGTG